VTDEEILAAYEALAAIEGIFCEPASAASLAGLIKAHRQGIVAKGSRAVCVLTGHGLKDPGPGRGQSAARWRLSMRRWPPSNGSWMRRSPAG